MTNQPNTNSNFGKYFAFFWPLSLMGLATLSGRLAQNFVLLKFENGVRELAIYALVIALVQPLISSMALVPQMVTFWSTTEQARKKCFIFILGLGLVLTCPLLLMAWTPLGGKIIQLIYGLDQENADIAAIYLRYLSPVLLAESIRQYVIGLLIRKKQTILVTLLRSTDIAVILVVLAIGVILEKPAVETVGMSALAAAIVCALVSIFLLKKVHTPVGDNNEISRNISHSMLLAYFWPLAGTTVFFTLSRPIIFKLVTCLPHEMQPTLIIASISLSFNVGLVFQLTINQFRHLLVRYVGTDPAGVISFMFKITTGITIMMAIAQITGCLRWFLVKLQNASGMILDMASDGLWILCLAPAIVAWRNYYHGLAMVRKKTGYMVIGGAARNLSIAICGSVFLFSGILNHWTATSLIVIAFFFEGLTVMLLQGRDSLDMDQ